MIGSHMEGRQAFMTMLEGTDRRQLRDHEVRGRRRQLTFEQDVEGEENSETGSILSRVDVKMLLETEDLRITDVGTIEEREEIKKGKPRDKVNVAVGLAMKGG